MGNVLTKKEIDELLQNLTSGNIAEITQDKFANSNENSNIKDELSKDEIDALLSQLTKNQ